MQQRPITLANLAGTTLMTLFSEAVSRITQEKLTEPALLSEFLERQPVGLPKKYALPAGWVGHYLVGQGFAAVYALVLKQLKARPSTLNGLAMGVLSGLAGIGIWKATFKLHPNPPKPPAAKFYTQLLVAHVVFGLVADAILQLQERAREDAYQPQVEVELAADTYYPLQDENAVVSPS
jgi:hypothetical protein